ncbi:MFS transporter [Puia dinghuensis]|uniref:Bcr/CflA family drug resistance efflux transporter n=1 Tax=Puia dinghuensis TaxID=1792502 RepID=A0A8J2XSW4_9BACT|nr:MFS transporter [Puia dinghuensis]GGA98364.1 Bcr/CflA family drug resistance efflux transporter [Puia dinghuensis]
MRLIKEKNRGIATVLAFALIPLTGLATDVYLPSLPAMAADLHVSSGAIQNTLLVFLVTAGISQLFVGSLLDSFGRFRISIAAMLLFSLASFVIANTHSIYVLFAMRVVHGITVAIIAVGKRAYFLDTFEGEKLRSYTSLFSIVWATAPIVAPFIGGYLQAAFGWHGSFYFLGFFTLAILGLDLVFGGESLKTLSPFKPAAILNTYGSMLKTRDYGMSMIIMGLSYSMLMVYGMTSPFIIEHVYRCSPIITGYSSLLSGVALMTGGIISKSIIHRPLDRKIPVAMGLQTVVAVALLLVSVFYLSNLYTLLPFVMLLNVGAGFIFNNIFSYALGRFHGHGGIVSGLTGGGNFVITSFFSYGIVNTLVIKNQAALAVAYLVFVLLGILSFILFQRYRYRGTARLATGEKAATAAPAVAEAMYTH